MDTVVISAVTTKYPKQSVNVKNIDENGSCLHKTKYNDMHH
jgi:hypothetical protein